MSSSTVSSFWKEQASATRPGNSRSMNSTTRCAGQDSTSAGSCRLAAKEHLLQRVAAQPEAERLERDHLVGRDVAEVDRRPEVLDEPGLARLGRGLEDQVGDRDLLRDLVDEVRDHLAGRPVDAGGPALAALGD